MRMASNNALSLSSDGIALLVQDGDVWRPLAEMSFDAGDPDAALAGLCARAAQTGPDGRQVLLILPDEQIRYLDLPDPGGDAARVDAARAALDGATPYKVAELVFDWQPVQGRLQVAAVARETLDEAESFIAAHGFEPVSFAAAPAPGAGFAGAPFFGAASGWGGPAPQRIAQPIRADRSAPPPAPDPGPAAPAVSDDTASASAPPAVDDGPGPAPAFLGEPAPAIAEPDAAPVSFGTGIFGPGGEARSAALAPLPEPAAPRIRPAVDPAGPDANAPSFSSIRASRDLSADAGSGKQTVVTSEAPATAPRPSGPALRAGRAADSGQAPAPAPMVEPTPSPAPETPAPARRRKPAQPAPARAQPGEAPPAMQAAMAGAVDPDEERRRMTVFGARREDDIGGKPRFLGLMLTVALLLFLLAVAAWASTYIDEGLARLFGPSETTETEVAAAPAEPENPPEVQALLPPDPGPAPAPAAPAPAPARESPSPEEAAARYAATGIWQRSPAAPPDASPDSIDDVYVASVDPDVGQFDAVALPPEPSPEGGAMALPVALPPGPDVRFDLDARGLVRATPEGAVSPDGVRVFTGPPPRVPPTRSVAPPDADGAEAAPASPAADPALGARRPAVRPGDLVEQSERVVLQGISVAELEQKRPVIRPESLQPAVDPEPEETAAPEPAPPAEPPAAADVPTGTSLAVARSREPQLRPQDMARRAEETTVRAAPAPVAAPTPNIPQNANVARQATVSNQLNLREMNLIGVFGSSSNRRALVRLSNGRLQNVKVGDRLDGGRVAAIGEGELHLTRSGRNVVLKMPRG